MNNNEELKEIIINEIDRFLKEVEVGDASQSPLPSFGDRLNSIGIEDEYE